MKAIMTKDQVLPNWKDHPELIKWKAKHQEIITKLEETERRRHSLSGEIEQTQAEVVRLRSSVLLGEGNQKDVVERENFLAGLRQQQEDLSLDELALRDALKRAEGEVHSAEKNAKIEVCQLLVPLYREKVKNVQKTIQAGVEANRELQEFEHYLAKQQLRDHSRLLRRPCAIQHLAFPDGFRNWEKSLEPILADG